LLISLTTTGARSGRRHTVELGAVQDGDTYLVVASAGGADRHPAWFHNLRANPTVTAEIDGSTRTAIAVPAVAQERDRLFDLVVAAAPGYADYQRQTSRVIPVVVLHPVDPDVVRVRAAGDELVALHGWFRDELAALRAGAAVEFTDDLRGNCLAFCVGLERHHMGEDFAVFSFLQQRFPELSPALEQLRAEHVKVARLRSELSVLAAQGTPAATDFDRLADELTAHLDREEAILVPLLNALPDVPWPKVG
jgi:deazaflavin-dependent oxidoreductase (nitroreductase family)